MSNASGDDTPEQAEIWVDDSKPAPNGCAVARTYDDALRMMRRFRYSKLYLDHDLGEDAQNRTGYDLLMTLISEKRVPPKVECISWNPVGRQRIADALTQHWPQAAKLPPMKLHFLGCPAAPSSKTTDAACNCNEKSAPQPISASGDDEELKEALNRLESEVSRQALTDFSVRSPQLTEARQSLESLFGRIKEERDRARKDIEAGYSDIYKTQLRYRESARAETERRGFREGELQSLWRGFDCFTRKYDQGEVLAAICDALTREGCTAWSGDGTSCVEQMIRLQWERAEKAEAELGRIREELKEARADKERLDWLDTLGSFRVALNHHDGRQRDEDAGGKPVLFRLWLKDRNGENQSLRDALDELRPITEESMSRGGSPLKEQEQT